MSDVILVAVDFEEGSEAALRKAETLARDLGASLALVHVARIPFYVYPDLDPKLAANLRDEIAVAAKKSLIRLSEQVGAKRWVLREGEPSEQILEVVEELRPSMVVMGTHGRRGVVRLFVGSVAERVVRRSPVPVMTVRLPETAKEAAA